MVGLFALQPTQCQTGGIRCSAKPCDGVLRLGGILKLFAPVYDTDADLARSTVATTSIRTIVPVQPTSGYNI